MYNSIDIYFYDFNEETQKAILEAAGLSDPSEANWDVLPITSIEFYDDDEGDMDKEESED